jgi:hypothetical protein
VVSKRLLSHGPALCQKIDTRVSTPKLPEQSERPAAEGHRRGAAAAPWCRSELDLPGDDAGEATAWALGVLHEAMIREKPGGCAGRTRREGEDMSKPGPAISDPLSRETTDDLRWRIDEPGSWELDAVHRLHPEMRWRMKTAATVFQTAWAPSSPTLAEGGPSPRLSAACAGLRR